MKENFSYIPNYEKATVADLEADGLLDTISKIHIVGFQMYHQDKPSYIFGENQDRIAAMLDWHIENKIPMVFHNGIGYDKRALEIVLGKDLSELMIIDTLWLSYYLNIDKKSHSIEELSKDYDVAEKFFVDPDDWVNLSKEDAIERVVSDVEIGKAVWDDFKGRLEEMYSLAKVEIDAGVVGGKRVHKGEEIWLDKIKGKSVQWHVSRILGYISSIADVVSLQEQVGWMVDQQLLDKEVEKLEELQKESAEKLEAVMPPAPKYVPRSEPKRPFKKNGELSASGQRWEDVKAKLGKKDEWGNPLAEVRVEGRIHELTEYNPPNINSSDQVKNFLFSKGWKPETFNYVRDQEAFSKWINNRPKKGSPQYMWNTWRDSKPKDRAIPQVKDGGDLCASVSRLAESIPEVAVLEEYSIIQHRIGVLKGIKESIREDGRVEASAFGLTNTLRLQHRRPIVNLPSVKRLYAEAIRGCLVAEEGNILLGSDLSSLM